MTIIIVTAIALCLLVIVFRSGTRDPEWLEDFAADRRNKESSEREKAVAQKKFSARYDRTKKVANSLVVRSLHDVGRAAFGKRYVVQDYFGAWIVGDARFYVSSSVNYYSVDLKWDQDHFFFLVNGHYATKGMEERELREALRAAMETGPGRWESPDLT